MSLIVKSAEGKKTLTFTINSLSNEVDLIEHVNTYCLNSRSDTSHKEEEGEERIKTYMNS